MRVLLVGGGKVGSHLAVGLRDGGHVVSVVEADERRASHLAEEPDILVFRGDGSDVRLMRSAGVERMDWVLAVTGVDEDNLVVCQLAATLGAANVLARLNDPRNAAAFDSLGVPSVSVTDLMAQVLSREIEVADLSRIAITGSGQISIVERLVPDGFTAIALADLDLPPAAVVATLQRGDDVFVPDALTMLRAGDRLTAVTSLASERAFYDLFDATAGEQSK
jgi:trk system potassium uptake protein TrkA